MGTVLSKLVFDGHPRRVREIVKAKLERLHTEYTLSQIKPRHTDIDIHGDLLIKIKAELENNLEITVATFLVCSRTVARGSVVLEKMLFGPFKEGKRNRRGQNSLNLYGDEPKDMLQLFNALHGDRRSIGPASFKAEDPIISMYDFMVVVDKYDSLASLAHYAPQWVNTLQQIETDEAVDLYQLAFIFYQLGSQSDYERIVSQLITDCAFDHSLPPSVPVLPYTLHGILRPLFYKSGRHANLITETVSTRRNEVIEGIIRPVREIMADLSDRNNRDSYKKYCTATGTDGPLCTIALEETLAIGLINIGLWPIPDSNHHITSHTPRDLYRDIIKLKQTTRTSSHPHRKCGAFRPGTPDERDASLASSRVSILGTPHRGFQDLFVVTDSPRAFPRGPNPPSPPSPPPFSMPASLRSSALPLREIGAWECYAGCASWGDWYQSTPGEQRVMQKQRNKL